MSSQRNGLYALLPQVVASLKAMGAAHTAEVMSITANANGVAVGQMVTVTISLTSAAGFSCWGQALKWDPATLQLVDLTIGNQSLSCPFGTIVTDSRTVTEINRSGEVRTGGYYMDAGQTYPNNAAASGAVAVFTFTRTAAGPTTLTCPAKTDPIPSGQPTTANDFGCVLIDSSGQARSPAGSTLTLSDLPIDVAPGITTQPANRSVNVGQTAIFTVVASGNPAPTYQWRRNGSPIGGATASSYTTPVTVLGDHGTVFSVVVTNRTGMQTSANATLSVSAVASPLTITSLAPSNGTVGVPFSFSCTATGTGPITWSISSGALPAGLTINTATGGISGTPTQPGLANGTLTAANSLTPAASQAFAIAIAPGAPGAAAELALTPTTARGGGECGASGVGSVFMATLTLFGLRRRRSPASEMR